MENNQLQREQAQAKRLKNAYERMLAFERERQTERQERELRKKIASSQRNR